MRYMNYILIALAVVGVLFFLLKRSGTPAITSESLQQARERGDKMLLLDVRSQKEFDGGHIPGAVNVPHDRVSSAPDEVSADKAEWIVIYCERGPRALMAQRSLIKAGFTNVDHLLGDMSGWRSSGLPTLR